MPLGRDLNRRTWVSGIAAAIPDAMALMRGSILMPEASEGVAVLGGGLARVPLGLIQLYRSKPIYLAQLAQ